MDKPTLLYTAGSYGALLLRMLNGSQPLKSESYHEIPFMARNTEPNREDHHLLKDEDIDGPVIKITYTDNDVSLINRNKWQKVKGHLREQAEQSFPNHPNREIYTMAIHVCNLLGDNHFKKISRPDTIEFKFSNFLHAENEWCACFKELFNKLGIEYNQNLIKKHFNSFLEGQKSIREQHKKNNDDISVSYIVGKEYFSLYNNNYNQIHFDNIFDKIRRTS